MIISFSLWQMWTYWLVIVKKKACLYIRYITVETNKKHETLSIGNRRLMSLPGDLFCRVSDTEQSVIFSALFMALPLLFSTSVSDKERGKKGKTSKESYFCMKGKKNIKLLTKGKQWNSLVLDSLVEGNQDLCKETRPKVSREEVSLHFLWMETDSNWSSTNAECKQ